MPEQSSIYTADELGRMGFSSCGENVSIDRTCRIFGPENIRIGSHVRIDSYTVISAAKQAVEIGSYVHLGHFCVLTGQGGIAMEDYSGLSARVAIYSSNDDYSGEAMANPTVPEAYRGVRHGKVVLRKHAVVGSGSVIMPGVELALGAAVGALTFVRASVPEFTIMAGNPMRKVGVRSRRLLDLEASLSQGHPRPSI